MRTRVGHSGVRAGVQPFPKLRIEVASVRDLAHGVAQYWSEPDDVCARMAACAEYGQDEVAVRVEIMTMNVCAVFVPHVGSLVPGSGGFRPRSVVGLIAAR
jgi:hypothetical protein